MKDGEIMEKRISAIEYFLSMTDQFQIGYDQVFQLKFSCSISNTLQRVQLILCRDCNYISIHGFYPEYEKILRREYFEEDFNQFLSEYVKKNVEYLKTIKSQSSHFDDEESFDEPF